MAEGYVVSAVRLRLPRAQGPVLAGGTAERCRRAMSGSTLGIMGDPRFERASRHPDGWRLAFLAVPALFLNRRYAAVAGSAGRGGGQRHRRWFRAPARCRSEAPTRENWPALQAVPALLHNRRYAVSAVARHPFPWGVRCREGRHPEGWGLRGRGPAGRCADQRSAFPCQPVVTVGGVGVVAGSAVHKEEPRGRMAPGFPFDFRSDGFQETQIPTSPRT